MGGSTHEALPLRTVSRMTGLSPDIIRAWEKRYGVVHPHRGPRGARLYSSAHVAHLRLLGRVVASGRAIGDVAKLGHAELTRLAGVETSTADRAQLEDEPADTVNQALGALQRFDAIGLDSCLAEALIALGAREFGRRVVQPLLEEVGQRWADGRLSVAEEHLLSASMRGLLIGVMRTRGASNGPVVLLATPSGERHEFGLLLAALMVAAAGLRVCYLGTDLPAAEIITAAGQTGAVVVGLGVVNGDNYQGVVAEVRRIERGLPPGVELWLGGRQANSLAEQLGRSRAIVLDEEQRIEIELERIRATAAGRP